MRIGSVLRITKREWYALGGFANSRLWRRGTRHGWKYFYNIGE
jgi:hypothetical protein